MTPMLAKTGKMPPHFAGRSLRHVMNWARGIVVNLERTQWRTRAKTWMRFVPLFARHWIRM